MPGIINQIHHTSLVWIKYGDSVIELFLSLPQLSADIVGVEMGRESNGKQFVMYLLNVGKGGSSWDVAR